MQLSTNSYKSNSASFEVNNCRPIVLTIGRYLKLLPARYNYRPTVINPIEFWALKLSADTYKYRLTLITVMNPVESWAVTIGRAFYRPIFMTSYLEFARVKIFSLTRGRSCYKDGKPRICRTTATKSRRIHKGKNICSPAVLQPTEHSYII